MRILPLLVAVSATLSMLACDDDAPATDDATDGTPDVGGEKEDRGGVTPDWTSRIAETWLHLDLSDQSGSASIYFEPGPQQTVSLEAAGLTIDAVYDDDGPVKYTFKSGDLHVQHAVASGPLHIDYHFKTHAQGEGYAKNGSTVLWPYYCENLFPCRSQPDDGMRFELSVAGYKDGMNAIYPEALGADAPSYTLAFAIGQYTCLPLGKTSARTAVEVCYLPRGKAKAERGTKSLRAAFDWLEKHIGRYTFGKRVASVAVAWGPSAAGGMEHHPFWHVATSEMDLPLTHVHEAVHGWFGTGVRIGCWEDFVLSEGTTSYLAAHVIGEVSGEAAEDAIWDEYAETLAYTLESEDIVAWPDSCGKVDILRGGLFSNIVYMKGAFFWREVADAVTPEVLDAVLARFYEAHVGGYARMADLVDAVRDDTGFEPDPLVAKWLRSRGNPLQ